MELISKESTRLRINNSEYPKRIIQECSNVAMYYMKFKLFI